MQPAGSGLSGGQRPGQPPLPIERHGAAVAHPPATPSLPVLQVTQIHSPAALRRGGGLDGDHLGTTGSRRRVDPPQNIADLRSRHDACRHRCVLHTSFVDRLPALDCKKGYSLWPRLSYMDTSKTIQQEFNGRNRASGSIISGLDQTSFFPAIPSADNLHNHKTQRTTKPVGEKKKKKRQKPHRPHIIDNTEQWLRLRRHG